MSIVTRGETWCYYCGIHRNVCKCLCWNCQHGDTNYILCTKCSFELICFYCCSELIEQIDYLPIGYRCPNNDCHKHWVASDNLYEEIQNHLGKEKRK